MRSRYSRSCCSAARRRGGGPPRRAHHRARHLARRHDRASAGPRRARPQGPRPCARCSRPSALRTRCSRLLRRMRPAWTSRSSGASWFALRCDVSWLRGSGRAAACTSRRASSSPGTRNSGASRRTSTATWRGSAGPCRPAPCPLGYSGRGAAARQTTGLPRDRRSKRRRDGPRRTLGLSASARFTVTANTRARSGEGCVRTVGEVRVGLVGAARGHRPPTVVSRLSS
jgi:hypothetical protein